MDDFSESNLTDKLFKALVQIQSNRSFIGAHENTINDGLRDRLNMVFDCYDQTRQGVSENEIDSGQVDILVKHNGIPVSIIEALRLDSLRKDYLDSHVNKLLTKYDFNGIPVTNIVIYASMVRFSTFWEKCVEYLKNYSYPYPAINPIKELDTHLAEIKHAKVALDREGTKISLHFFVIHMRDGKTKD